MKQVVQEVRSGRTLVREIPEPIAGPGQVVVATVCSLISAGTERSVVELARRSLVGKARARPDHLRRVIEKAREEGLISTTRQVLAKLNEPMPLGYSAAGVVLESGRDVSDLRPGDRVACVAPHAGVVSVGRNLCTRLPDAVSFEQGAYASVAAIALEGIRLAHPTLGDRILVIGLGLVGQLAVALLRAHGCSVFGVDVDPTKLALAREMGAEFVGSGAPLEAVRGWTKGQGVDAVVIAASTQSNAPIEFAAEAARVRGRIVLVGVVGLELPRPPFFKKELEFTVSSSLGPGRDDPRYEDHGIDHPFGYVRWTAGRNLEAAVGAMGRGQLPVERLTSHRFPIGSAEDAYALITSPGSTYVGVILEYPQRSEVRRVVNTVPQPRRPQPGALRVSVIGAGNFARLVLLPTLSRSGDIELRGIASARGLSAAESARRSGFAFATTDAEAILADDATDAVFIATRHDSHARLVLAALEAGKHVFVEKPLAADIQELGKIAHLVESGASVPVLAVGFNRRAAPATRLVREHLLGQGPLTVLYRFAVPALDPGHWTHDPAVGGGRLIGEACHAIDLCTSLSGTPELVYAAAVRTPAGTEDRLAITINHADGGMSVISYEAGGDRAFSSERIEVYGGGRTAVIDGWGTVELWSEGRRRRRNGGRDRGHQATVQAFLDACRTGTWPVAWPDIYASALATLLAQRSLHEGVPLRVTTDT